MTLFLLIHNIASRQCRTRIGACKWVKHSNIKKCMLPIPTPKVPGYYIKPSTIFPISCSILQRFTIKRLKSRFNTNIWTNLTKEISSEVMYFIMTNCWKATTRTTEKHVQHQKICHTHKIVEDEQAATQISNIKHHKIHPMAW